MLARIVVGTASWADSEFRAWYPPGLNRRDWLAYYAQRFAGVEVNSTFYAVPARATVERWDQQSGEGFTFAAKLHRALSRHAADLRSLSPDLRDSAETSRDRVLLTAKLERALLERLLDSLQPLRSAGKLSCLLLQLSPAFRPPEHRLDELNALIEHSAPIPLAVEFRHRAWVSGDQTRRTLGYLSDHDAAFVCTDAPDRDAPTIMARVDAVTSDRLTYLRAHGRNAEAYLRGRSVAERFDYRYSDQELGELAVRARGLAGQLNQGDARVVLNNNRSIYALENAETLGGMLNSRR